MMHLTIFRNYLAQLGIFFVLCGLLCGLLPNAAAQEDSGFKYIEVKVIGPDGQALPDVSVDVKIDNMEFPMPTNQDGQISLNVPSGYNHRLQLSVKHDTFVAVGVRWSSGKGIPEKFEIPLQKGTPIGGLVLDEKGQPVEGAKVEAARINNPQTDGKLQPLLDGHLATTDEEGRWQILTETNKSRPLHLRLSHADYVSDTSYRQRASWEQLLKLDHPLVLKKGIELRGQITDPDGESIAGALVSLGGNRYMGEKKETQADAEGNYRFSNVSPANTIITVAAKGWASELRVIPTHEDMEPVDFQLQFGKSIQLLVTDPDDVPVEGVGVMVDEWRGHRSLPEKIYRGKTNAEGIWKSVSMPADEVDFDFFKQGHMSTRGHKLTADGEQHTIVMPWPVVISGSIVDAESGLPVEKFNIVQGIDWGNRNDQVHWKRHNIKPSVNGKYRTEFTQPRAGHLVRIEAEGYRPAISRVVRSDEGKVTINFELEEGAGPSGLVKMPDGELAVGAKLYVATPSEGLHFRNGMEEQHGEGAKATTDEQGKYSLPFLDEKILLICLHETGWARLSDKLAENAKEIQLQAWSKVEGTLLQGKEPLAGEPVALYFNEPYVQNAPRAHWDYQATSDADGKFLFDHVLGGEATVARSITFAESESGSIMTSYSHNEPVSLVAGQTTQVQLGGTGRAIKGRLKVPKDYEPTVAWNMGSVHMSEQSEQVASAQGFFHAFGKALAQTGNRPQKPKKQSRWHHYAAAVDAEGGFAIPDVMPGHYRLRITLYAEPVGERRSWNPIGTLRPSITVPEPDEKTDQDPFDVGEFVLKMVEPNPPAVNGAFTPLP